MLITFKQQYALVTLTDCKVTVIKFCNKPELLYFQSISNCIKAFTAFAYIIYLPNCKNIANAKGLRLAQAF